MQALWGAVSSTLESSGNEHAVVTHLVAEAAVADADSLYAAVLLQRGSQLSRSRRADGMARADKLQQNFTVLEGRAQLFNVLRS